MNQTRKWTDLSHEIFLHLLDSLPLPDEYKTNHLLDPVADARPDLPAVVEPVLLNAITVQTTFMPSADTLPWHPEDPDPILAYQNRECRVKRVRIDTSDFTSDLYPQFDHDRYPPVFDDDDIPFYDLLTKVNHLDVGTMNDYWFHDPDDITVNAIKIAKDDPTAIRGQFDSGADATVTNLLMYLHNYWPYTRRFKCPVRLTGAVGSTDIFPLGGGFLNLPAPTPSGYLGVHVSIPLTSPPPWLVPEIY